MLRAACSLVLCLGLSLSAQQPSAPRYPVAPRSLPDSQEIALALSAAPGEVSARADVYALRGTRFEKIRAGSSGVACMVARDSHEGSAYPICFDQESARTVMPREMREVVLRAQGVPEAEVVKQIRAEMASGKLPAPTRPALAYMMSPHQVLFSSPDSAGVRVGRWWPHVMIAKAGLSAEQLGLSPSSSYRYILAGPERGSLHDFVIIVAVWSDGTAAREPR